MADTGRFSTHHVPDDGTWHTPGDIVRVDRAAPQVKIIKDPTGDFEVHSCRQATEYTGGAPLLRVGLKRIDHQSGSATATQAASQAPGRQV